MSHQQQRQQYCMLDGRAARLPAKQLLLSGRHTSCPLVWVSQKKGRESATICECVSLGGSPDSADQLDLIRLLTNSVWLRLARAGLQQLWPSCKRRTLVARDVRVYIIRFPSQAKPIRFSGATIDRPASQPVSQLPATLVAPVAKLTFVSWACLLIVKAPAQSFHLTLVNIHTCSRPAAAR